MRRMTIGVLAVAAGLGACGRSAAAPEREVGAPEVAAEAAMPAMAERASVAPASGFAAASMPAPSSPAAARMIVRSADLAMQVADVRRAMEEVTTLTAAMNGFLGGSRQWRDGEATRATMTLRVPAARLDSTLAQLRRLAVRVENESVSGEDVTRQAVDLSAQLTNLRATEIELRALLTTVRQKTQRASDVLEVHAELARVRGEIETRTAELQSLTQLAALSTITLSLAPDGVAAPLVTEGWQARGVWRDATRALFATGRGIATVGIWALVYGVPLLLLAATLTFAWRLIRRRRADGPAVA